MKNVFSLLVLLCCSVSISFAQQPEVFKLKITESDYSKLSASTQKIVDKLAANTCDCYNNNIKVADILVGSIVLYSKAKKADPQNKEDVILRMTQLKDAITGAKPFFDCMTEKSLSQEEKDAFTAELNKSHPKYTSEEELSVLKGKFIFLQMVPNCGEGITKKFDLIFRFMSGVSKGPKKESKN